MNKVILMGRLTRDPENRVSQSGISVTSFSLAVDRGYQKAGEERQTDFINCVAFSNTADFIKRFFVKGQLVLVMGSIQTRTWEGQDGKKNYVTEVVVSEAHFTGDRRDSNKGGTAPSAQPEENKEKTDDGFLIEADDADLPF